MRRRRAVSPAVRRRVGKPRDFRGLADQVLRYAGTDVPPADFLRGITQMLMDLSGCSAVELRVKKEDTCYRCEGRRGRPLTVAMTRRRPEEGSALFACTGDTGCLEEVCRAVVERRRCGPERSFTAYGSFWTGDAKRALPPGAGADGRAPSRTRGKQPAYLSVAVVPLVAADETVGLVLLKCEKGDCFHEEDIRSCEEVAPTLGLALLSRLADTALSLGGPSHHRRPPRAGVCNQFPSGLWHIPAYAYIAATPPCGWHDVCSWCTLLRMAIDLYAFCILSVERNSSPKCTNSCTWNEKECRSCRHRTAIFARHALAHPHAATEGLPPSP